MNEYTCIVVHTYCIYTHVPVYSYGVPRSRDKAAIAADMKDLVRLQKAFPGLILGYDLVEQEDLGHPLTYFLDQLLAPSQEGHPLRYFFHAGETSK